MPAGGAETQRRQQLSRDFRRVDLREPEGPRAESREQLPQTGSTVLYKSAQRHDLGPRRSAVYIEDVGLDLLVGGDGEPRDIVLPCREGRDRALPPNLRMVLSEETIGLEIVARARDHDPCLV